MKNEKLWIIQQGWPDGDWSTYGEYAYYSVHEARDMMYAAKKVQNDLELRVVEYKPRESK